MPIPTTTDTFSNIKFYRDNTTNRAIAVSASGSGTPINELGQLATLAGTLASSGTTVTGTSTTFTSQVAVGDILYTGAGPTFLGIVAAIASNTSLTLEAAPAVAVSGATGYGQTGFRLAVNEKVLVRIPAVTVSGTQVSVATPYHARTPISGNSGNLANPAYYACFQESTVGSPNSPISPTSINLTLNRLNSYANDGTYITALPSFTWLALSPLGGVGFISAKTIYDFFTNETLPNYQITVGVTPYSDTLLGYL